MSSWFSKCEIIFLVSLKKKQSAPHPAVQTVMPTYKPDPPHPHHHININPKKKIWIYRNHWRLPMPYNSSFFHGTVVSIDFFLLSKSCFSPLEYISAFYCFLIVMSNVSERDEVRKMYLSQIGKKFTYFFNIEIQSVLNSKCDFFIWEIN